MIIQSNCDYIIQVDEQREICFKPHEPIVIPAQWAVPALIDCPENLEVISSVAPGMGCEVTWQDQQGGINSGIVLTNFSYEKEEWIFVQKEHTGRFLRTAEIIGVNPAPLFRVVKGAMQALGTPEARTMAINIVLTLCGLKSEDKSRTQDDL